MVLTEAMAAGIPVVALDAPGVQEVVVDQKNGRLLYSENIDQFASALRWIASLSPKQKHRLRQEAGKTAQRFSMDNSVEKALSHYKRLLENESVRWRWHGEFNRWTAVLRRMKTDLNILKRLAGAAGVAFGGNEPKPDSRKMDHNIWSSKRRWA